MAAGSSRRRNALDGETSAHVDGTSVTGASLSSLRLRKSRADNYWATGQKRMALVFKTFSILVTLASCAGGAEVTRNQDIEEVVDLKIPDQFLPSRQRPVQKPAKEDDTGAVQENISDLVNVKIPIIENNDITTNNVRYSIFLYVFYFQIAGFF